MLALAGDPVPNRTTQLPTNPFGIKHTHSVIQSAKLPVTNGSLSFAKGRILALIWRGDGVGDGGCLRLFDALYERLAKYWLESAVVMVTTRKTMYYENYKS